MTFYPDVNGCCVKTITLGALLLPAPDFISCGRRTITVSHRPSFAETTILTIADWTLVFGPLVSASWPFPRWRLLPISLRVLTAAPEHRRKSVRKLLKGGSMGDERCQQLEAMTSIDDLPKVMSVLVSLVPLLLLTCCLHVMICWLMVLPAALLMLSRLRAELESVVPQRPQLKLPTKGKWTWSSVDISPALLPAQAACLESAAAASWLLFAIASMLRNRRVYYLYMLVSIQAAASYTWLQPAELV